LAFFTSFLPTAFFSFASTLALFLFVIGSMIRLIQPGGNHHILHMMIIF
jgi:hypothetical protein